MKLKDIIYRLVLILLILSLITPEYTRNTLAAAGIEKTLIPEKTDTTQNILVQPSPAPGNQTSLQKQADQPAPSMDMYAAPDLQKLTSESESLFTPFNAPEAAQMVLEQPDNTVKDSQEEEQLKLINAIKVKYGLYSTKRSLMSVPEPTLSKDQIKDLMIEGATVEDIYEIAYLSAESGIEAIELYRQKNQEQVTWDDLRKLLKVEDGTSVNDEVYGNSVTQDVYAPTVTDDVYMPLSNLSVSLSSLDMNISSVISDFEMEVINQTNKPQYSDRSQSSESIDPISGSLTWKDTQISLPGRDGLDLNVGIMYNSNQNSAAGNYYAQKDDLGVGWTFRFPSLQYNDYTYYYHNGEGAVYAVDFGQTGDLEGYTHFKGYKGRSMRFMEDTGHVFSNGQDRSSYYVEYADKRREYFGGSHNSLLGIVDRFGNTITFNYSNIYYSFPGWESTYLLTSITDSVGRTVKFQYDPMDHRYLYNLNEYTAEEKITVSVLDLQGVESQKVSYVRDRRGYSVLSYAEDNQTESRWIWSGVSLPVLKYIENQNGERITFSTSQLQTHYNTKKKEEFKDWDSGTSSVPYFQLNSVNYPHSRSTYKYGLKYRNYGPKGSIQSPVVLSRYDELVQSGGYSGKYNITDYTYNESYDAYPTYYKKIDDIPASYLYSSIIKNYSGTTATSMIQTLNGKGQLMNVETLAPNGERKVQKNTSFHNLFILSPLTSEYWEYGDGDSDNAANKLYSETSYDEWGNVATATRMMTDSQLNNPTLKSKNTVSYLYEPSYRLLSSKSWYASESDAAALTESYTYTAQGRMLSTSNAAEEITNLSYVNAPDGTNHLFQAIAVKSAGGKTVSKSVVTYGPETGYAYPTIQEAYSNIGQSNEQIVRTTTAYDVGTGRIRETKDGNDQATTYMYDGLGRPVQITYPAKTNLDGKKYSQVEYFTYTSGQISGDYDAVNAGTHSLVVNTSRTLTQMTTGAQMTTYDYTFYNGLGQILLEGMWDETKGKWLNTQYHYDDIGRPVYTIDPAGDTLSVGYDAWGSQNRATTVNGVIYVSDYDLKARKSISYIQDGVTGNKLNYVEESYDPWGNKISASTYMDWPANKQRITEAYRYNISGSITSYTDANNNLNEDGVTTSYSYDTLDRLTAVKDALNQTTNYTYDGNGLLSKVTIQAKGATPQTLNTKAYNELGLLTVKSDSASQSESYQYNSAGELTSKTDRNGSTTGYSYDESGQLKKSTISGVINNVAQTQATEVNFGSEGPNYRSIRILTNNGITATQTQIINSLGQVSSNYSVAGNHSAYLVNQTDVLGRTTRINDSYLGFYTNYQYNKQRLDKVQTNGNEILSNSASDNVQYSYFANDLIKSITYPTLSDGSILKSEYTYNQALGWTESLKNTKGGVILSGYNYSYDNNGNRIAVSETRKDGTALKTNYTYDRLNRLISIARPDGTKTTYTYDVRGNRLTNSETLSMQLDATDTSYTYDLQNTLTSVTKLGSKTSFQYYADGMRYLKTKDSVHTQVNYNLNGQVLSEEKLFSSGAIIEQASYVRADRVLVKKEKKNNKQTDYYYLYNGHGDVVQIVDTAGVVINNYTYDEWGKITSQLEGTSNSFKYTGEIYDAETGLYYLRARYYDPSMGRFLNEDSVEGQIDNPLTQNLYTYVINNPLIYSDPTGNEHAWGAGWGGFAGNANSATDPWKGWSGPVGSVVNFLILDDVNTLRDPSSSGLAKSLAAAGLVPVGSIVKGGKLTLKLLTKEGKTIEKEFKLVDEALNASKKLGCNCFTAGTKVQTDEGEKNIEDIEVGDKVLAKSEYDSNGELAYKEVTALYRNQRDDIIKLHVGEQVIETTDNHPFWVQGKGWVFADELQVGDKLQKADGSNLTIEKVEFVKLDEPVTVYNFTVADYHTYYVTGLGIWVHNTQCYTATKVAGEGTHLRRTFNVDGTTININSGHGYNRAHSTGSVQGVGSMDLIENAILGDIGTKINKGFEFATLKSGKVDYFITVNGQKLGYNAMRLDNGSISVSTYFLSK